MIGNCAQMITAHKINPATRTKIARSGAECVVYRNAVTVAPHGVSGCAGTFCASRRHRSSTQITPTNAAAFTRNDAPIPGTFPASGVTAITISIPITGPTARATFNATEFSATASGNSLGGTNSGITY
jgi:hypothetical protein